MLKRRNSCTKLTRCLKLVGVMLASTSQTIQQACLAPGWLPVWEAFNRRKKCATLSMTTIALMMPRLTEAAVEGHESRPSFVRNAAKHFHDLLAEDLGFISGHVAMLKLACGTFCQEALVSFCVSWNEFARYHVQAAPASFAITLPVGLRSMQLCLVVCLSLTCALKLSESVCLWVWSSCHKTCGSGISF